MKKLLLLLLGLILLCGCTDIVMDTKEDVQKQESVTSTLSKNQSTPTDINYSLERYNLIKRAYWVNGQREKANSLQCEVQKPLGYIVLFTESGSVVGNFVVDGKVTSLNSYLTPSYIEEYEFGKDSPYSKEISDIDGSYGENDNGIFFFTPDGKYIEWTGIYLYSDIPFIVDQPIVKVAQ